MVEGDLVEPSHRSLLLVEALCLVPGGDLGFDLRTVWPSDRRLIAIGVNEPAGPIGKIRSGHPSMEHIPTTLAGGRFLQEASGNRAPVGGDEIQLHAKPLEQVGGYLALRLIDRGILGYETGDGLTRMAAFRK